VLADSAASPLAAWVTLAAGNCTFLLTVLVSGVFSEVPFAAILLALVLSLSRWPARGAILASALLALGALMLRYAGALAFLLLVLWIWCERQELRTHRRLILALGAAVTAGLLAAALLLWNRQVTGYFSGDVSRTPVSLADWPRIAADLGWALPTAVGGILARDLLGFGTFVRLPVGWLMLALLLLAGVVSATDRNNRLNRALGALVLIYLVGMVALRCHGHFDDLHNGRMIFPVLVPLFLLTVRRSLPPGVWIGFCTLTLSLNLALCLRGASLGIGADVRPALPHLAAAGPDDIILINEPARSLAALVDVPVRRLASPTLTRREERSSRPRARHIVIAAAPTDRAGTTAPLDADGQQEVARWLNRGYREIFKSPTLVVLQMTGPSSPPP